MTARMLDLLKQGFTKFRGGPNRFIEAMDRIRAWERAHGRPLALGDPDYPWERAHAARREALDT